MESQEDIDFLKETIKITRNKMQLILFNKQPFYSDYLDLANQLKGEICMISNADIWLKSCDIDLINLLKNENIGFALTRHEHDMSRLKMNSFMGGIGSFDSFIFKSTKLVTSDIDHVQNIPGSEHIFKYFMEKDTKIKFYNPCFNIVIVHEHKSDIRNYDDGDLIFPMSDKWKDNKKATQMHITKLYPRFKDLKQTPPITKKQLLNLTFQYERRFKSVSSLFGR